MKQEIEALEKETGQRPEIEEISKQLIDARASLATLSERLGKDHPDVVTGPSHDRSVGTGSSTARICPCRKSYTQA